MIENKEFKVLKKHRLMQEDLSCVMVHVEGANYRTTVTKEVEGFRRVVCQSNFVANSHRHAIRKLKRWLDSHYPLTAQEAKAKLEDLFS